MCMSCLGCFLLFAEYAICAAVGLACMVFLCGKVSIAKANFIRESMEAREKEDCSHKVTRGHSQRAERNGAVIVR